MAYCPPRNDPQGGFATPAALVFSLALALVSSAVIGRSLQVLYLNRGDLERARQAAALDGAHLAAAAEIVRSGVSGPYHWAFTTEVGALDVIAEPEADKLNLASAAALGDADLASLGVSDVPAFRARLSQAAASAAAITPVGLDAGPLWRACGPSVASPWGQQDHFTFVPRHKPGPSPDPASWHIGEAWRVRIATPAGWSDDRIVRFTGNARQPAATVMRTFGRGGYSGLACETLLADIFAG